MFRLFIPFLLGASCLTAAWTSPATGQALALTLLEPAVAPAPGAAVPVVIYLLNLAAPRAGTEPDAPILADLRAAGHLVVLLDYARHPAARWPSLNRDFVQLRADIRARTLLVGRSIDQAHVFIVPSGHRLKRDVVFYREPGRVLALDLIYPSRPKQSAGTLLEFSCDNQDRMGNYSLWVCTDTILEGAATEGFAVAMADHPVAPPYKGLDPMPDCAWKIKAAVRTLRAEGAVVGLNGRIVPVGFSRGSGMALMLVTTAGRAEFEGRGEHPAGDSSVQGAVVLSGRFTYLDLLPHDHMLPLYEKTWGRRAEQGATWRAHGALDYLAQPAAVPLFLSINASETSDALHQMEVLRDRLVERASPFAWHPDEQPRGHHVPLTAAVLGPLRDYLQNQLNPNPPSVVSSP